ncbi:Rieske 2Fe-2S domain-containing protein [Aerosakkonemataceae cyanobacterium BLCC-F154]|uniref:Rieske 2Fe-2S domain-containing protein n=1 Tax=Floridaenema fluviatile BLCC-F154 TaxID=3153640 RepID=A0ABV4YIM0_9CYAN
MKQTAKSVGLDRTELIPFNEITQRLLRGEIIVVPECLQRIGYFEEIKEASLAGIRQATNDEKAAQVRRKGLEEIHTVIDVDDITSVSDQTYKTIRPLASKLAKALVREIFQEKTHYYFEESPNVRFHIPYDLTLSRRKELNQFKYNGKITPHGPHHDSWYQCPTNCVNVWIAIGPVKVGNGLNIYPTIYGKKLPCTQEGKIVPGQSFGPVLSFNLQPGDALIFHGEHLHSSELNSTDFTRFVISMRMVIGTPHFLEDSPYKDNYIFGDTRKGIGARFSEIAANLGRNLRKKLNRGERSYILSNLKSVAFNDNSDSFPTNIPVESIKIPSENKTKTIFDSKELPVGSIRPISNKMCVARLPDQRVIAFSRYCSHEGADLASGYLRDGCVVCPWHSLPFNLKGGASPCQSLASLEATECVENEGKVEVTHN